jgi:DNA-binding transcriptional LysR family regulator
MIEENLNDMPAILDLDLLRTLAVFQEVGGLARAARRVGRTVSAVSLQMKRLQDACGRSLFRKDGRRLRLTADGETVLAYARRMLALNDELARTLARAEPSGTVRLGVPQDVAERWLPRALARFARGFPGVQLQARVERNAELAELVARGELDLAVTFEPESQGRGTLVASLPVHWLAAPSFRWNGTDPLPLVMFEPPCMFRRIALEGLDRARIPWVPMFTSPSLTGLWAAVSAGLGVTVRTELAVPAGIQRFRNRPLPSLPPLALWMHGGESAGSEAVDLLRSMLLDTLRRGVSSLALGGSGRTLRRRRSVGPKVARTGARGRRPA